MPFRGTFAPVALASIVVLGCGNESAQEGTKRDAPATIQAETAAAPVTVPVVVPAATPAAHATGAAVTLSGTIAFEGTAPERKTIKMGADPNCSKLHTAAVLAEDIIVQNGKLQNVFVYVKSGLEGKTFPTPAAAAVLDQRGCMYIPHVLGVQVNQAVKILNSDATLHNVHAMPKKGEFNVGMPRPGMEIERKFTNPEVMVHFKCDVHPWMSAWVGVLPHPYFAISGADGSFSIPNLPAGSYTIEAWHEKLGTQVQNITVGDKPAAKLDFTFKPTTVSTR